MLLKEINVSSKANLTTPKRSNNVNFTSMASTAAAIVTPPPVPMRESLVRLSQITDALPQKLTDLLARQRNIFRWVNFTEQADGKFVSQDFPFGNDAVIDRYNTAYNEAFVKAVREATPDAKGVKELLEEALTIRAKDFPYEIKAEGNKITLSEADRHGYFFGFIEDQDVTLNLLNPELYAYLEKTPGLGGLKEVKLTDGNRFKVEKVDSKVEVKEEDGISNPFTETIFEGIEYTKID